MAGDEGDGGIHLAMGDGDAGIGEPADPGADPGHDAEGDAGGDQRQRLFSAAPEDEGIAALEAQHPPAFAGEVDEAQRDVALPGRRLAAALAGIFQPGARTRQVEDAPVDQGVVDDVLGLPQAMQHQDRQQARVAGTGSGKPDAAGLERWQIGEHLLHEGAF